MLTYSQRFQMGLSAKSAFSEPVPRERSDNGHLDKLYYQISDGYKILVLMRGMPGSGKSTLARHLLQKANLDPKEHIVSADDYFTDRWGNYNFDRSKLSDAHADCQSCAKSLMMKSFAPIIVDNTNIRLWEMEPFCVNAVDHGYIVQILEPTTTWAKNPDECYKRNSHGVPHDTILNMRRTYERIQNGQELLDHFHLPKRIQFQLRELPPIVKTPEVEAEPDVIKCFSPIESNDDIVVDSEEIVRPNPFENFNWKAHEREIGDFWKEHLLPQESEAIETLSKTTKTHSTTSSKPSTTNTTSVSDVPPSTQSFAEQMLSALKDDGTKGVQEVAGTSSGDKADPSKVG